MSKSIFVIVRGIIADQLGVATENISMDTLFSDDLGADSLDLVELIMALEEAFNLEISEVDAEQITTVGDAVEYIESRKQSNR